MNTYGPEQGMGTRPVKPVFPLFNLSKRTFSKLYLRFLFRVKFREYSVFHAVEGKGQIDPRGSDGEVDAAASNHGSSDTMVARCYFVIRLRDHQWNGRRRFT
jgi:hypothetical protein